MRKGTGKLAVLTAVCILCLSALAAAQGQRDPKDVFRDKLFAPQVILEHRDELGLTKEQFTAIRAAVVEVQTNVAGHEWDLREAYLDVIEDLDDSPVDEARIMANVEKALLAENEVKKLQVAMLLRLRNLLTDEQVEYLKSVNDH